MIAQYFNNAAELARSCTMPRHASSTTRVVYTYSRENSRFNEDFEMLHPAETIDPFKVWRDVNEYMRLFFQVRKKVEAAEKDSRPPPQGSWTRPLWLWTHAPKQMWSEQNPEINQSLKQMRNLFLDQLVSKCMSKTE